MLTEKDIHAQSLAYFDSAANKTPFTRDDFRAGATWANEQNAAEIQSAHKMSSTAISDFVSLRQKTQEEIDEKNAEIARHEAEKTELFSMLDKVRAAVNQYSADMEITLFKEIEFVLSKHAPKTA